MSLLALNQRALACAKALERSQPRCDSTIDELPQTPPLPTDEFPFFRASGPGGSNAYKATFAQIPFLSQANTGTLLGSPSIYVCHGSPNGVVSAWGSSLCLSDNGTLYVNTGGASVNTVWTALAVP